MLQRKPTLLSICPHKPHMDCTGIEPRPLRRKTGEAAISARLNQVGSLGTTGPVSRECISSDDTDDATVTRRHYSK